MLFKNTNEVITDIKIIFRYSAIKIIVNNPPEYSVLKPDTNSLSPSDKSNGVRFVSAKIEVNHIKKRMGIISIMLK